MQITKILSISFVIGHGPVQWLGPNEREALLWKLVRRLNVEDGKLVIDLVEVRTTLFGLKSHKRFNMNLHTEWELVAWIGDSFFPA